MNCARSYRDRAIRKYLGTSALWLCTQFSRHMRLGSQSNALQSRYRDRANAEQNKGDPPLDVAVDAETNKSGPKSHQDALQQTSREIETKLSLARVTLPAGPSPGTEIKTRPTYPISTVGAAMTMELRFHNIKYQFKRAMVILVWMVIHGVRLPNSSCVEPLGRSLKCSCPK